MTASYEPRSPNNDRQQRPPISPVAFDNSDVGMAWYLRDGMVSRVMATYRRLMMIANRCYSLYASVLSCSRRCRLAACDNCGNDQLMRQCRRLTTTNNFRNNNCKPTWRISMTVWRELVLWYYSHQPYEAQPVASVCDRRRLGKPINISVAINNAM